MKTLQKRKTVADIPELADHWHPTKNGDLKPEDVTLGSDKMVVWQCKKVKEHTWPALVRNRVAGTGCPCCAGRKEMKTCKKRKKWTIKEVKKYFLDHECELLSTQYISMKGVLEYKCKCGKINRTSFNGFLASKYKKCHLCVRVPRPSKVKIGERYGKLSVIGEGISNKCGQRRHLCRCDCGREKQILDHCLRRGMTKTCGKCKKDSTTLIRLEGKVFGSLKVIRKTEKNHHGEMAWECMCSCGRSVLMASRRLRTADYPSCGDEKCPEHLLEKKRLHDIMSNNGLNWQKKKYGYCRRDLVGMRFGSLVVKEVTDEIIKGDRNGCACICDCGNELLVGSRRLRKMGVSDCGCITAMSNNRFNEIERNLVLGTLLGDGSLRKRKSLLGLSGLLVSHSIQQEELVDWKFNILKRFVRKKPKECANPGYKKTSRVKRFRTIHTEEFGEIYRMIYGTGKKKITESYLSTITHPIALAVWYMDDGSCSKKQYSCNISTESFLRDEVQILADWLKAKWGICGAKPYAYKKKDKEYIRLSLNAKARDQFFEIIRPYIIPSMEYKLSQPEKSKLAKN